jgi:8-oxo-dGTP diphosphatase
MPTPTRAHSSAWLEQRPFKPRVVGSNPTGPSMKNPSRKVGTKEPQGSFCYDWTMKTVVCVDINGKNYEVPASRLEWRPSVYGIVIKDNKVLLSKQFGNKYDLPGGGLDLGEKPDDGVIREIKEETGIDAKNPKLVGIENSFFQSSHAENKSYQSLLMYYFCEYVGGTLSTDGFDEYEKKYAEIAEWIPLDRLNLIELASTVDYRPYIRKATVK